ncbi:MAG: sulfotransferase [Planctomycetota bacterium]
MTRYLFITGPNRSGTTWVGNMLDSHHEIAVLGEAAIFRTISDTASPESWLDADAFEHWRTTSTTATFFGDISRSDLEAAARRGMVEAIIKQRWNPKPTARVLGDRTPYHTAANIEAVHRLFPDAVVVPLCRDGRDVVVSSAYKQLAQRNLGLHFGTLDEAEARYRAHIEGDPGIEIPLLTPDFVRFIAKRWSEATRGGERASQLFGSRCITLSYESLLENAADYLANLFRVLGVSQPEASAHRATEAHSFRAVTGRDRGDADPTSLARSGIAGAWQEHFDDGLLQAFRDAAEREPDDLPM